MWVVRDIEFRSTELDFSSSGQGRHRTTAVVADGTEIINALDLVDLDVDPDDDPIQLIVCTSCGVPGCESGNCVAIRRLDDGLVVMPCFDAMADERDAAPPYFMTSRGVPFLRGGALERLRGQAPGLADPDRWPSLSAAESARLVQFEAPAQILGAFPDEPRLREEVVLAVGGAVQQEAMAGLASLLLVASGSTNPVALVAGEPVTFYLDLRGFADEWAPLVLVDGQFRLAVAPGVGVTF
jgi:hypothetical protein